MYLKVKKIGTISANKFRLKGKFIGTNSANLFKVKKIGTISANKFRLKGKFIGTNSANLFNF